MIRKGNHTTGRLCLALLPCVHWSWFGEESEYKQLKCKGTAQPFNSWVPLQTQMTSPQIALQPQIHPVTLPTLGSRAGSAAWAMGAWWLGTIWGHLSPSSSSASWLWPSSTWCKLSSTGGPSKTRSFLSSSTSVGPGPLQALPRQPRCSVLSPPRPLSKSSLNYTETMRQRELFDYKKWRNYFLCGFEQQGLSRDYTSTQSYLKDRLCIWVFQFGLLFMWLICAHFPLMCSFISRTANFNQSSCTSSFFFFLHVKHVRLDHGNITTFSIQQCCNLIM